MCFSSGQQKEERSHVSQATGYVDSGTERYQSCDVHKRERSWRHVSFMEDSNIAGLSMDEKQFFAVIIDVNLRRYSRLERYLKLVGISTPTSDRCEAVLGDTEAAQVFGVSSSDYTDAVKASGFTACDDQGLFKIIRKEAARRKYKRKKLDKVSCIGVKLPEIFRDQDICVCYNQLCAGTDGLRWRLMKKSVLRLSTIRMCERLQAKCLMKDKVARDVSSSTSNNLMWSYQYYVMSDASSEYGFLVPGGVSHSCLENVWVASDKSVGLCLEKTKGNQDRVSVRYSSMDWSHSMTKRSGWKELSQDMRQSCCKGGSQVSAVVSAVGEIGYRVCGIDRNYRGYCVIGGRVHEIGVLATQKISAELTFTEKVSHVLFIDGASKGLPVSKLSDVSDLLKGIPEKSTGDHEDVLTQEMKLLRAKTRWRMLKCVSALVNKKKKEVTYHKPLEVKRLIDSVAESASSKSPVNLSEKFNKLVREAFMFLGSFSASDFFPNGGWIIDRLTGLQGWRERSVRDLDDFYEQMFDLHKQGNKNGVEDFVDLLLRLEKEETVLGYGKLTRNHIKAILMLHYLKMVIKETWRLHPPAPLLVPREVISEFEINGYKIQPKTLLHVNAWAIGRDPDTWKDPEVFFPERFMDNDIDAKGQNFELLPFGSGRRICPGMYMGTTMVEFGLANMLYQFDWKLPEGMVVEDIDMEEAPGLTVGKKNELLLVPVKY
ncbi:hypothetical protein IGI04_033090 [Brassica rapa subsp. trilocularis]|uniref:Cytochrome P450 n=1 Tax=Brassica rapa subsp. trilocularis TaxID=1813537 RepID=A0ABQ7L719_BRACM|nr:hypothetical protein IGI04_033090 [Brassica rapa subsp. trilocularis]